MYECIKSWEHKRDEITCIYATHGTPNPRFGSLTKCTLCPGHHPLFPKPHILTKLIESQSLLPLSMVLGTKRLEGLLTTLYYLLCYPQYSNGYWMNLELRILLNGCILNNC